MSTTKLLRWSGLASIGAGVLFALATLLHPPSEDVPAIISAAWVPAHAIGWVANLLRRQSPRKLSLSPGRIIVWWG